MLRRLLRGGVLTLTLATATLAAPGQALAGHRHGPGCGHADYGSRYRGHSHRYYPRHRHHHHGSGLAFGLGVAFGTAVWAASPRYVYEPVYVSPPAYVRRAPYYAATGKIETDIDPSRAAVYLDGYPVGAATDFDGFPGRLEVEAGMHDLEIREPGYEPLHLQVEVLPRHTTRIDRDLIPSVDRQPTVTEVRPRPAERYETLPPAFEPAPAAPRGTGSVDLFVEPPDARVYVDGRRIGEDAPSSLYQLDLGAGRHRIEVVKPGFDTFVGEVELREHQRQELRVRLRPARADS